MDGLMLTKQYGDSNTSKLLQLAVGIVQVLFWFLYLLTSICVHKANIFFQLITFKF